jgi:hypothetical protein
MERWHGEEGKILVDLVSSGYSGVAFPFDVFVASSEFSLIDEQSCVSFSASRHDRALFYGVGFALLFKITSQSHVVSVRHAISRPALAGHNL